MFWKCWFHQLVFNAEYGLHSREENEKKKKKRSASLAELEINNIYLKTHIYLI